MRIELRYCQIPICKLPADYDDLFWTLVTAGTFQKRMNLPTA